MTPRIADLVRNSAQPGRLDWIGLSEEEQRIVWEATRTPRKVKWPEWWTYEPE